MFLKSILRLNFFLNISYLETKLTSTSVPSSGSSNLSKRKRSQRDLLPRLSNGKSESSAKNSHYYTLSHFESVNLFYIHRSDCSIELNFIESEIESEFEDSTMTNVKNPQVNAVYGYFSDENNQYFRVSVISEMEKKEGRIYYKKLYL